MPDDRPHRIHAAATGAGPVVWLLHSLLADAGSGIPLAERLSATHRVMLADLPGFGGSAQAGPGLDAVADALVPAIAAAGAPSAIIGNGYGSFVALSVALRHPHLVSRLVLAGAGAAFSEPARAAFRGMAAAAREHGLAAVADTAMRRLFAPGFQAAHPALLAERRARFLATDLDVFTGACLELAALDLRDRVASLALPVLVIVGADDEATPPPMAWELVGLLPDARLIEMPGCAHVPQLQDTDGFYARLDGFL